MPAIDEIPYRFPISNRTSIIDSEELTALELAGRTTEKVNEVITQVNAQQADIDSREKSDDITNNRKLSPNGNFTGSWFGYSNPIASDPGIQTIVNSLLADNGGRGANIKIAPYNAVGDGVSDDTTPFQTANTDGKQIIVPPGTFLINSSITFNQLVTFMPGAILKVRNGAVVIFEKGINAGWYTIFDTTDDFITDLTANSSVIIKNCRVKADWFCAKVSDISLIKTISDQTSNLTKAYRAAVGNFVASGTNFITAIPSGVLELGNGYYRVDKTFALSKLVSNVYYRVTGFRLMGQGPGASYLIRTDNAALDYVVYALYTGELTKIDNFKITCYNPDGATDTEKFHSASRALMFLQGDSLQLSYVWVSGAQTGVTDINNVVRNGVGFQFSSCVDTYFDNLFVELCVTGLAVGSSQISGTNLELFTTLEQAIGFGVFDSSWPDVQTTSSIVNISNIQANASKRGVKVLENGDTGLCNIVDSIFDGYNSEFGLNPGLTFVDMNSGTSLMGNFLNVVANNFNDKTFLLGAGCFLGRTDKAFIMIGCSIKGQTSDVSSAVFTMGAANTYANLMCLGLTLTDIAGIILDNAINGNVYLDNITLSRYTGKFDASTNRQLFVSNGVTSADIDIRKVKRNASDTVPLTQFGFANAGNVYIDIDNLFSATRAISGNATVTMPSKEGFGQVKLQGNVVYDPSSLADGAGEISPAITVTGANFGDFVIVSAPYDLQGITVTGYVSAVDTARIRLDNKTGGVIDLPSGTWKVKVIKG